MPSLFVYQQHIHPDTGWCQLALLSTKEDTEPDGELFLVPAKQQQHFSRERQLHGPLWHPIVSWVSMSGLPDRKRLAPPRGFACMCVLRCLCAVLNVSVRMCCGSERGEIVNEDAKNTLAGCLVLFKERDGKERNTAAFNNATNSCSCWPQALCFQEGKWPLWPSTWQDPHQNYTLSSGELEKALWKNWMSCVKLSEKWRTMIDPVWNNRIHLIPSQEADFL